MAFVAHRVTALFLALGLACLSGCAAPTTTTVGVTTNQAPKFQDLGR
jgi:hypothetical protein